MRAAVSYLTFTLQSPTDFGCPEQVFRLLERLPLPIFIAVLLVAATCIRISECLGLRWQHVKWSENRILIEQVFRRGEIVKRTKTKASKAAVPMCEALAIALKEWRQETPYSRNGMRNAYTWSNWRR